MPFVFDISTFGKVLTVHRTHFYRYVFFMGKAIDGFYFAIVLKEQQKAGLLHNHFITCTVYEHGIIFV